MHETGLMRAAVAALAETASGQPVRTVTLAIGSDIDLAPAIAAWQAAATGTPLEGCHVQWQRAPDRLRCFTCGSEYDGAPLDPCPTCSGNGIVIKLAPELTAVDWTTQPDEGVTRS